jgi:hypothetical protein
MAWTLKWRTGLVSACCLAPLALTIVPLILYRQDIKTENVLVKEKGIGDVLKVAFADFGIATDRGGGTMLGEVCGTPGKLLCVRLVLLEP